MDTHHGTPIEPPCAHQSVPITDEYAESVPFHKQTRCIRIVSDVNCLIDIGNGGEMEPRSFLPAGQAEERIVHPDARFRLCAILAPVETACDSDRLTALIALVTNPKAAAQRKAELEKASTKAQRNLDALRKEQKALDDAKAKYVIDADVLAKEKLAFSTRVNEVDGDLSSRETGLAVALKDLEDTTREVDANLTRREVDVTHRENTISERIRTLSADERKVAELKSDLERRINHFKAAAD
jgi:hypothetical protein